MALEDAEKGGDGIVNYGLQENWKALFLIPRKEIAAIPRHGAAQANKGNN